MLVLSHRSANYANTPAEANFATNPLTGDDKCPNKWQNVSQTGLCKHFRGSPVIPARHAIIQSCFTKSRGEGRTTWWGSAGGLELIRPPQNVIQLDLWTIRLTGVLNRNPPPPPHTSLTCTIILSLSEAKSLVTLHWKPHPLSSTSLGKKESQSKGGADCLCGMRGSLPHIITLLFVLLLHGSASPQLSVLASVAKDNATLDNTS